MEVHDPRKERFLRRPSGSEVSGENWPVAGSNIPEEPSPEGEAGGGEVLAGGSEELVPVGWAELSVLVEVSGGKELVVSGGVQLNADVRLEKVVPFRLAIRLGRALGETRHVVVAFVPALLVIFEIDEGFVAFKLLAPGNPVENNARHACGGVGMSLKDNGHSLAMQNRSGILATYEESRLAGLIGPAEETVASASNETTP